MDNKGDMIHVGDDEHWHQVQQLNIPLIIVDENIVWLFEQWFNFMSRDFWCIYLYVWCNDMGFCSIVQKSNWNDSRRCEREDDQKI